MFYSFCGKIFVFIVFFSYVTANTLNKYEGVKEIENSRSLLKEKDTTNFKIRHKRSQKKKLEIEDAPENLLKLLDMSCISNGMLKAPDIENGKLVRIVQRKGRNGEKFLVALYSCSDGYSFELGGSEKLYCSKGKWIGEKPECTEVENETTEEYSVETKSLQNRRNSKDDYDEYDDYDDEDDNDDEDDYKDEDKNLLLNKDKENTSTTIKDEQHSFTTQSSLTYFEKEGSVSTFQPDVELDYKEVVPTSYSLYPDSYDDGDDKDDNEYVYKDYSEEDYKDSKKESNVNVDATFDETKKVYTTTMTSDLTSKDTTISISPITTTVTPIVTTETVTTTSNSPVTSTTIPIRTTEAETTTLNSVTITTAIPITSTQTTTTTDESIYSTTIDSSTYYKKELTTNQATTETANDINTTYEDLEETLTLDIINTISTTTDKEYVNYANFDSTTEATSTTHESITYKESSTNNRKDISDDYFLNKETDSKYHYISVTSPVQQETTLYKTDLSTTTEDNFAFDDKENETSFDVSTKPVLQINNNVITEQTTLSEYYIDNDNAEKIKSTTVFTTTPEVATKSTVKTRFEFYDDEDEYIEGSGTFEKNTKTIDSEITTVPFYQQCSHSVVVANGIKTCFCPAGFKLSNDNITCEDINECNEKNDCEHICHNTEGSYICSCDFGFIKETDHGKCVDDNECLHNNGHCSHTCINNFGSFLCACPDNYRLNEDKKTCVVINPCMINNGGCSHSCSNDNGTAICNCPLGYFIQNQTCVALDPCKIGNGGCSDICKNVNGEAFCSCLNGYELVGKDCYEIDPCSVNNGGCTHYCEYVNKEVVCNCQDGYVLDKNDCIKKDLCSMFNGGCSHNCSTTSDGIVQCLCPNGYYLQNKTCILKDPCTVNNGNCTHLCVNEDGVAMCKCPEGFEKVGDSCTEIDCPDGYKLVNNTCELLNPCLVHNGGCSHNCSVNQHGFVQCSCPDEYTLHNQTCVLLNPCVRNNGNCSHVCKNINGQAKCHCPLGYHLNNSTHCKESNACDLENGGCSHICNSIDSKVVCSCPTGYNLIDKECYRSSPCSENNGGCADICQYINETVHCACQEGFYMSNNICLEIESCTTANGGCSHICNTTSTGHVLCLCPDGYQLNNKTCRQTNPCLLNNGNCSHICTNDNGRPQCSCPSEYTLKNATTCHPTNPCKIHNGGCSHQCINLNGTSTCECPMNHKLVNKTCVLVNPCLNSNGGCSHICKFENNEIKCLCPEDYTLYGRKCVPNNPCHFKNGGCSHICTNVNGEAICECPLNMTLINRNCSTIDPCSIENGGCSHHCTNVNGQSKCSCPKGLRLEENVCVGFNPCLKENGGCSHICDNNYGTVSCLCPSGYILRPNRRVCKEINACRRNLAKCSHGCKYMPGSHLCTCPKGYTLDSSKKQCVDIDECAENNGNCKELCRNYPGGYRCGCARDQILDKDGQACRPKNKNCPPLMAPRNGKIKCARDSKENYYQTGSHCIISCNPGYKLNGDPHRICDVSGGWGKSLSYCLPSGCSRLGQVARGRWVPFNCSTDAVSSGQQCTLQCEKGYKPLQGYETTTCVDEQRWHPHFNADLVWRACVKESFEPIIHCPSGGYLSYNLPSGQNSMLVTISKPETNVDWWKHVTAEPSWGKDLSSYLGPGRTEMIFTAHSPSDESMSRCRLIISIFDKEPPTVSSCPSDMEFRLARNEYSQVVFWDEPRFHDNVKIAEVYKSKEPGSRFGPGLHQVNYVAHDESGNKAGCHFSINILREDSVENKPSEYKAILICPHGIRYMSQLPSDEESKVSTQEGCYWSNIRVKRPANLYSYKEFTKLNQKDSNQRVKKSPFYWYHKCC